MTIATQSERFDPHSTQLGGYSDKDGTLAFFNRVRSVITPSSRVLDLGAGRGAWAEDSRSPYRRKVRSLKGHCHSYVGADVDPVVLDNKTTDVNVVIENPGKLPFDDNCFDVVIADYVLEHVSEPQTFVGEVARVLRSDGYFCARTPHKYHYVSIIARMLSLPSHRQALRHLQPERRSEDVFPTCYKLNTLREVARCFAGWTNYSYIFATEPSYYCGRKILFDLMSLAHGIVPASVTGNLFVFVQKPGTGGASS